MNWIQNQAVQLVLPYLLAPLVFVIVQGLKKASSAIDHLPAWAKQGAVFVVAQILTFLQAWSGQTLECGASCTIADVSDPFVKGVLVTLTAFLLHYLKARPVQK